MTRTRSQVEVIVDRGRAAIVKAWERYNDARDRDDLYPCEYGHLECSHTSEGPCMNELEIVVNELGIDDTYIQ